MWDTNKNASGSGEEKTYNSQAPSYTEWAKEVQPCATMAKIGMQWEVKLLYRITKSLQNHHKRIILKEQFRFLIIFYEYATAANASSRVRGFTHKRAFSNFEKKGHAATV